MDLKAIEAWSHEMLVAEAQRRGVLDPELRSRPELVRAILRHQYATTMNRGARRFARGMAGLGQAKDLLNVAMEAAAEVMPGSLDRFLGLRASMPLPEPPASKIRPSGPTSASPTPAPATPPSGAAAPSDAPNTSPSVHPPTDRDADEVEEDVIGEEPHTRNFVDEPIRTHSMARLLAQQGHRQRALGIYQELLQHDPGARELQAEMRAIEQGGLPRAEAGTLPGPVSHLSASFPDTGDRIECESGSNGGLRLKWTVSAAGQERARAVLGGHGELAIRVVTISPDPERVVRSRITEHGPVTTQGHWIAEPTVAGARCFAAVGLRSDDRFVSIVHACA